MKLSDMIIEHGPYESHEAIVSWDTAQINELRAELIAARKLRELLGQFQVYGVPYPMALGIAHNACLGHWYAEVDDQNALAELVQRAEEHTEVCR